MNKNLRLRIEESVEKITISENLCFLCLACLHEKITYSQNHFPQLEKQRDMITRVAIKNGVDKQLIADKIQAISKNDYPTFKQIERVTKVIDDGIFNWECGFIPDRWIHYKSEEEIKADLSRKPVAKKVDVANEELKTLCDYIQKILGYKLTQGMIDSLKRIRTKEYSYTVILNTFQQYLTDIERGLASNSFIDEKHKFNYILGIVQNKLPDVYMRMEWDRKSEEKMDRILSEIYENLQCPKAEYQTKSKNTPEKYKKFL